MILLQATEVNKAIDVMCEMPIALLKQYESFINSILDYLESLSESQIRKVYELFSRLCYEVPIISCLSVSFRPSFQH